MIEINLLSNACRTIACKLFFSPRTRQFFCCITLIVSTSLLQSCMQNNPPVKPDPLALSDVNQPTPAIGRTKGAIYQLGSDTYLYGNSRAHRVGDLLTVHVNENMDARDKVSSDTLRQSSIKDKLALTSVIKPGELDVSGDNQYTGSGDSHQSNTFTGDITVTVIRVLSNSNLVVRGYKTLTLSNGIEKVGIAGIVRQSDINSSDNSVFSNKIADAHIVYLGKGDLQRSANKGWFSKLFSGPLWPV